MHEPTMDSVRAIARATLEPLAREGAPGRVNRPLVAALGKEGLLQSLFPAGDGSGRAGASAHTICLLREALAYVSPAAEVALAMQGIGGYPILQSGQDRHVAAWLESLRRGDAVAAFALTEPEAGSDAANIGLAARRDGDGWRLTGEKRWITNAPDADFYVTFARTTEGAGARGVTAFLVPAGRPGLSGEPIELVSPHAIGRLCFDEVRVTPEDVLGEVDRGFRVAMATFNLFRPSVGAAAVGMAQAALDATVTRVSRRIAFGKPLASQQAIAHALADDATSLEAARHLVAAAATAYDTGDPGLPARAAMAKLFATETAQRVVDHAVQFHGASGLAAGGVTGQLYLEIRAGRIFEGASEIQRDIVARELFHLDSARGPGHD